MISFISLISLTLISLLSFFHILKNKNKKLPPGPKGIPILGHLHLLGKNPHQNLHILSKKHGPIMYMKFGFIPHIIVSSPQAAQQFLKTHDLVFSSRPPHEACKHISYEQTNLSFAPYGHYWRNMRKLCTLELLSNLKINSFQHMRKEELNLLVDSIKRYAKERGVVNLSAKVSFLTAEMSCRMVFGRKYEDKDINEKGFRGVLQEVMKLAILPNLGDYFPVLRKFDFQGLTRRMKNVSGVIDDFFEKIIDEHVGDGINEERSKDFVDTMMDIMKSGKTEFQFDRRHVKAVMLDMFAASADTSAATIEWTLTELIKNPKAMQRVQKELEQVVTLNKMVEESDLERLDYLNMVIKEALRLHPVAPLMLPHCSTEDCTINGYHIPKESRVIINAFAIGRDPKAWNEPEKFIPERFIGSNVDLRGQHFELLPFGSGRRSCPGMQLGLIVARLVVAQLVHCFDWELPNEMLAEELDMSEEFGLVITRACNLMVVPTYRLI
ncbi:hypothetical protein ACJIZ3_004781 [Penstemon smallii]|uniref:Cytochrome P450 n=1 Tax=Penstemon smallii TaxID=265156 RepID=A0ABD3S379_9LAMI